MTNDMTKGSPLKIFILFSIPLLIGNIFQQLYSMVDTIIVGRFVGVDALAAVGSTGSMFFLVNGMILGLTSGFSVLVSQKFGAKDEDGIKKAQQTFVRRLIAGAAVFFIILIVKIVVGLINTKDSGNAIKCIDSILNFKSYDDQRDEAIENTASSCIELYKNGKDYNNCICGLAVTIYNTEGGKIPDSIKKYDELNKLVQSYEGINNLSECPK